MLKSHFLLICRTAARTCCTSAAHGKSPTTALRVNRLPVGRSLSAGSARGGSPCWCARWGRRAPARRGRAGPGSPRPRCRGGCRSAAGRQARAFLPRQSRPRRPGACTTRKTTVYYYDSITYYETLVLLLLLPSFPIRLVGHEFLGPLATPFLIFRIPRPKVGDLGLSLEPVWAQHGACGGAGGMREM